MVKTTMWHAGAPNAEEVLKPEEEAPMRKKPLCRRSSNAEEEAPMRHAEAPNAEEVPKPAEEAPMRKKPLCQKKLLCGRRSSYAEVLCGTRKPLTLKKFLSLKKKLLCGRSPYAEECAAMRTMQGGLLKTMRWLHDNVVKTTMWHAEAPNAEEVPKPEEEAPMRKKPLCRRSSYAEEEAPMRKYYVARGSP